METNGKTVEKGGKRKKGWLLREVASYWFPEVVYRLYIALLVCLLVGGVVIAFTNHTGGWLVVIGVIIGVVIIAVAVMSTNSIAGSGRKTVVRIAVLLACVVFFMSSWFIDMSTGILATKEGSQGIVLYQGQRPFFTVPYTGKIHYFSDFATSAKISLPLDSGGDVQWEVRAKLNLVADHDQILALLREFRGTTGWMNEVQRLFQQEASYYVTEYINPDGAVVHSFTFKLEDQGQKEEFTKLGFSLGEVTVHKISQR